METDPAETDPVETDPVETDPVETDPVETDPVETDPVETNPVETNPVETNPVETNPVETNPVETDPVETNPVETDKTETGDAAHAHKLIEEEKASTCTIKGYHRVRCEGCDIIVSEEIYLLAEHKPSSEPTCTEPARCAECGAVAVEALGHDYQTYEVTLEATCTSTGSRIGTCGRDGCEHRETEEIPMVPHTTANLGNGNLAALTVENGLVMTTCGICKQVVPVSELRSLTLDFDKAVDAELRTKEDKDTYKYAYYESKGNAAATNPPTVRGSALYIKQNTSAVIAFDHSLLSDADVYAVSFKWRRTAVNGSSSQGLLGVCRVTSTGSVSGNTFVMSIDRTATSLFMSQTGATKAGFSAKKDVWDTITIVVDNTTGNAYIYINGTYFTTNKTETMKVSEAGQGSGKLYALHLGGTFNASISPEFDDFKIAAFNTGCEHVAGAAATCTEPQRCTVCGTAVSPALGHDLGAVTVTPATCIATGLEVTACNREGCDGVSKELPVIDHDFDVANATAHTPATCTTKGEKTGACEMGCGQTMTLVIDELPHTTANLGDLAKLTFVDEKIRATCLVCKGTVDVAEDARLTLDFDMDDLATEIAAKNAANSNLGLSLTNGSSYACVKSVLTCTAAKPLYINYNGKMLSDSAYYMISFDWRFTAAQTDGYSPLLAARTADRTGGVVACTYDRTDKVLRSGEAGSTVLYPTDGSKLTQNTWYHFTVVVNKSTGEAYVYVNNTYVNKVSSDCFKMDDGTAYSWQFNTNSSGHQPEMDNVKVVALDTSCDHVAGAAATCTTDQTCTVCDAVLTEKLGHDWGEASITNPTCLADGSETKTCERTDCGLEESTPIPKLGHAFDENAETTVVPSTCTVAGTETGTCINGCGEEVTVDLPLAPHTTANLGDLSNLTFVNGKVQAKCLVCNGTVDVVEDSRLVLDFEDTVANELTKQLTTTNGLATFETRTADPNEIKTYGTAGTADYRSVLHLPHNSTTIVRFNPSLLSDAEYYMVSFDWRSTAIAGTSSKLGIFGRVTVNQAGDGASTIKDFLDVDRSTGKLYNEGGTDIGLTITANTWYKFTILVDNSTGTAYVYIDGTCRTSYTSATYSVTSTSVNPAFGFGGTWNISHKPEFDNFKVVVLDTSCDHVAGAAATCTTDQTCTVCGAVLVEKLGHDWSEATITDPTCLVEGSETKTCERTGCEETESTPIPKLEHGFAEDAETTVVPSTCSVKGTETGTCINGCGEEVTVYLPLVPHTVESLGALSALTFKDGKIQATCTVCSETVDVIEDDRLVLNFDKADVATEINAHANKDAYKLGYEIAVEIDGQYKHPTDVATVGERSVLRLAGGGDGNWSAFFKFSGDMLKDASYYVVSFDVRFAAQRTDLSSASNKGLFACIEIEEDGTLPYTDASKKLVANALTDYAMIVDRWSLKVYNTDRSANMPATKNEWYTVNIIVDNATGNSAVYITNAAGAVTVLANENNKMLVVPGKTYAWRFGDDYNNGHDPQIDDFRVYALETVCNHLVEKTVPTTPATCTVAGEGKVVCARCGFEKRTVSLDPTGHKYSDTPDANSIAATCTEGGTNYFTCQNGCGNIKDESVAKAGHEKGEVKKELTCAMVYSCKNCTEGTVTEAKENATHTVAAPTAFDSTTVLKNNKIQGICSVCGLYADAPISETVCIQLDFDKTSLKAELEAKNTANSDLGLSAYYVNTAASGNDCFVVKSSGDRTVLNNANSGRLFLNFNEKSLADASYYVITFDWRYTAAQTGGSVNVFSVCSTSRLSTDISDPSVTNFFKYDRDVEAFTNGGDGTAAKPRTVYYPVEGKLIEDQWYTVTAIVNNTTGSANIYVNDTWSHTIKADSFKMTEDGTNAFRFGESSNGHVPEYDNLKVYKIGSSVSE